MRSKLKSIRADLVLFLAAAAIFIVGCGHPQAAPHNRQLIASLRTALSAQNPEWLEQNVKLLDERQAAGEISAEELEAFQSIVDLARAGRWREAEQRAIAFQKAQRPSASEVQLYGRPAS